MSSSCLLYNQDMAKQISSSLRFKEILENTVLNNYDNKIVYDKKIKDFSQQIEAIKPNSFFRYRTCGEWAINAMGQNIVTFSKPSEFNDPFDSLVYVDTDLIIKNLFNPKIQHQLAQWLNINKNLENILPKEKLNNILSVINEPVPEYQTTMKLAKPQIENMINYIVSDSLIFLKNYPYIACFSETPYSPTMWAHYADSHRGFVLEYDRNVETHSCSNCKNKCPYEHFDIMLPVVYSDERFNASNFVISYFSTKLFKTSTNIFIPEDDKLAMHKVLLHKSKDWEYEKEWRLISLCKTTPRVIQKPIGIYLGVNMPINVKKEFCNFALQNGIKVYEMYIDQTSKIYKINSREIKN